MAEDQAVNGDRWNDQFTKLLESLRWTTIGDSNMDLTNDREKEHGVDRLFTYINSFIQSRTEAVIFEAKNYLTTSYQPAHINTWITMLDKKITNLKNSESLHDMFPSLQTMPLRSGIIAIWFSNEEDYPAFREKFQDSLRNVKLSRQMGDSNLIYVLENDGILKLASLSMAIDEINKDKSTKEEFRFFYPADSRQAARRSTELALNYFTAKFILGEYVDISGVEHRVVFYLGKLDIQSFERLRHALFGVGYLDEDKPLTIYTYERDDKAFRKIEPEIAKIFNGQRVVMQEMEYLNKIPTFMRKK